MTTERKILFWVLAAVFAIAFVYLVRTILLPFVIGMLVAYFLDPAADRLERWRLSRTAATAAITVLFFSILGLFLVLLVPVLHEQFINLMEAVPQYIASLRQTYGHIVERFFAALGPSQIAKAKDALGNVAGTTAAAATTFVGGLLQSGAALLNVLSLIFITPVVTFYLLRDWDRITAKIDSLLPRQQAETIREQFRRIDNTLSGYIRGQTNVCLLLGVFYALGLSLVGLNFGLAIGFLTGLLAFIPFVGLAAGMTVGIAVAVVQFGEWQPILVVAGIFAVGQFIEGNFITPKLVGEKVGLHPVWVIFGLLAGGALFGFVGIFLAVPVTAIIGVLVRYACERYETSALYHGGGKGKPDKGKQP